MAESVNPRGANLLASNVADVDRFVRFAAGFRDRTTPTIGAVTFDIESCRVIRDGS